MIYTVMFRQRFRNGITNVRGLVWDFYVAAGVDITMFACVYYWIYREADNVPRSFTDACTYLVLAMLSKHLCGINEKKVAQRVHKGSFAYELLLPYSYPARIVTEAAADLCSGMLLKALPVFLLLAAAKVIALPVHITCGLLGFGSLFMGVLLMWGIQSAVQMLGFWYKDIVNLNFIMHTVFMIFSGLIIPYWFVPQNMLAVLSYTPFAYIWLWPMKIYFAEVSVTEACKRLLLQAAWLVILALLVQLLYTWGKRSIQAAD